MLFSSKSAIIAKDKIREELSGVGEAHSLFLHKTMDRKIIYRKSKIAIKSKTEAK